MDTNKVIACFVGVLVLAVNSCGGDSDSGGSYSESTSENAGGERVQGSQELKEEILSGLTREEKALRNYEDEMILKGETKSNPHYEELQRRAQESR